MKAFGGHVGVGVALEEGEQWPPPEFDEKVVARLDVQRREGAERVVDVEDTCADVVGKDNIDEVMEARHQDQHHRAERQEEQDEVGEHPKVIILATIQRHQVVAHEAIT